MKLLAWYKKLNINVKASFWIIVCTCLQRGISLITTPFFTRLLSANDYGIYSLYQTWYSVIYIIATFNFASGVFNKGMVKYGDDKNSFLLSLQTVGSLFVVFFFIIYLIFQSPINGFVGLPSLVMYSLFCDLFFIPAFHLWSLKQKYEVKYKMLVAVTLIMAVSSPILGYFLIVSSSEKGVARILSIVIINVIAGLVFYIYNFAKGNGKIKFEYCKYALIFNLPLIPYFLSNIAIAQADRIMIENMFGEEKLAYYSIAYTVASIINIFITGVNAFFVPRTYELCAKENFAKIRRLSIYLVLFFGGIVLLPIAVAPEVIYILAPAEYSEAIWIIPPVSISVYFTFVYTLYCNIEFAYAKRFLSMIASIVAAAINIVLNFFCMKYFGYIAAGYTTLLCYILLAFTHYIGYRITCKKEKLPNNIYHNGIIILTGLVLVGLSTLFAFLYDFVWIRYGIILILTILVFVYRKKLISIFSAIKGDKNETIG